MRKVNNFQKGERIGALRVVEFSHVHIQPSGAKVRYWLVECVCGKRLTRKSSHLSNSKIKSPQSCGCLIPQLVGNRFRSHGLKKHPLYNIWNAMIKRCYRTANKDYHLYGGRGIGVSKDWHSINSFIRDMGTRPEGHSLERIDNERGYCKENCTWSTSSEQSKNRRSNHYLSANGETKILNDWANDLNCTPATILHRLNAGWSESDAVTRKIKDRKN